MTPRQREFCRHYLRTNNAYLSARRAGYAPTVADKNAADILRSQGVANYLARHRRARNHITSRELALCADRMMHTIRHVGDIQLQIAASRELRHLYRLQVEMEPEEYMPPVPEHFLLAPAAVPELGPQEEALYPGFPALFSSQHPHPQTETEKEFFDEIRHCLTPIPEHDPTPERQTPPANPPQTQPALTTPADPDPLFLAQGLGPGKIGPGNAATLGNTTTPTTPTPETDDNLSTLNSPRSTFSRSLKTAFRHQNLQRNKASA